MEARRTGKGPARSSVNTTLLSKPRDRAPLALAGCCAIAVPRPASSALRQMRATW